MFNHMKKIYTVNELVAAYGGTKAMAEWCGVGESCVSNWKADAQIPTGWHLRMFVYACDKAWILAPELFGLKSWPVGLNEVLRVYHNAAIQAQSSQQCRP